MALNSAHRHHYRYLTHYNFHFNIHRCMENIMYFDDIETQLHAIIKINQILIEKIQNKRNMYRILY